MNVSRRLRGEKPAGWLVEESELFPRLAVGKAESRIELRPILLPFMMLDLSNPVVCIDLLVVLHVAEVSQRDAVNELSVATSTNNKRQPLGW